MTAVEAAEDSFFTALLAGDATVLGELIAADFTIVDVISGAVADRAAFLGAFRRGLLSFSRVQLLDRFTRLYGHVAVIVGRTEMAGDLDGADFAVSSRYTHVFVSSDDGRWQLVAAQGSRIVDA
jgi:ketosteroid isomerase-like protein